MVVSLCEGIQLLSEERLDGNFEGFLTVSGQNEMDFIQFAVHENGMIFYWKVGSHVQKKVESFFADNGWKKLSSNEVEIYQMNEMEICEFNDGLYANAGIDCDFIEKLVVDLMSYLYEINDSSEYKVEVVSDG